MCLLKVLANGASIWISVAGLSVSESLTMMWYVIGVH